MSIAYPVKLVPNHLGPRVARHQLEGLPTVEGEIRRFEPGDGFCIVSKNVRGFGDRTDNAHDAVRGRSIQPLRGSLLEALAGSLTDCKEAGTLER